MQVERPSAATPQFDQVFRAASDRTGTSFDYLVATAYRESNFRPDLKATTSTATGMFQFLEQQWLELIRQEGASVGLGSLAAAVTEQNGRYTVADPVLRQQILDLRKDPALSAVMAGKVTARNEASLTRSIGRVPTQQDLYVAHVLGPTGGARLIRMMQETPNAPAAPAFPAAAAANVPIFYEKDGRARTATEVYGFLARHHADRPLPSETAALRQASSGRAGSDPQAVAALVRAQTAAKVAGEGVLGAGGMEARAVRTAMAQTSLPGEATGPTAPTGGHLQGWRARMPNDAFAALMRTDTNPADGRRAVLAGALGYADPGASNAAPIVPRKAWVSASGAAAASDVRPGRFAARFAGGAPEAPLPMVTSPMGVPRPSRFSMAALVGSDPVQGRPVAPAPSASARAGGRLAPPTGLASSRAEPAAAGLEAAPLSILPPVSQPVSIRTEAPAAISPPSTIGGVVRASVERGGATLRPAEQGTSPATRRSAAATGSATIVPSARVEANGSGRNAPPFDLTRYMPIGR